jgi:hypothetical protein
MFFGGEVFVKRNALRYQFLLEVGDHGTDQVATGLQRHPPNRTCNFSRKRLDRDAHYRHRTIAGFRSVSALVDRPCCVGKRSDRSDRSYRSDLTARGVHSGKACANLGPDLNRVRARSDERQCSVNQITSSRLARREILRRLIPTFNARS